MGSRRVPTGGTPRCTSSKPLRPNKWQQLSHPNLHHHRTICGSTTPCLSRCHFYINHSCFCTLCPHHVCILIKIVCENCLCLHQKKFVSKASKMFEFLAICFAFGLVDLHCSCCQFCHSVQGRRIKVIMCIHFWNAV